MLSTAPVEGPIAVGLNWWLAGLGSWPDAPVHVCGRFARARALERSGNLSGRDATRHRARQAMFGKQQSPLADECHFAQRRRRAILGRLSMSLLMLVIYGTLH